MSVKIRATGISEIKSGSAIELAADAAVRCLKSSGVNQHDIGLMINAGVYKDDNLAEPSIASLIQLKTGLNLDSVFGGTGMTFSFDQRNGAAGFISSCNTADAWISSGDTMYAMVVASDCHPSKSLEYTIDFPFTPSGSAVLLEKSDSKGFVDFSFSTEGEDAEGIQGFLDMCAHAEKGRENITIIVPDNYAENLLSAIHRAVRKTADKNSLDLSRCYIVATQPDAGFSAKLASKLNIDAVNVIDLYTKFGYLHSAATGTGLHLLLNGRGTSGKDAVICASPGAGMGIATAVYLL